MTAATKLKPTPAMVAALTAKQLNEVFNALRGRCEGNPSHYGLQKQRLERIERAIFDKRFQDARDTIAELNAVLAARDDMAELQAGAQQQEALAETRGQPTAKTETGVSTRDGFLWLVNRKRYTQARVEAGRIFREKYAKATGGSVRSCLNDTVGGGGDATPTAAQIHAKFEIEGVKRHLISSVGVASGGVLFHLLEAVCGKGETVRQLADGDDRKSDGKVIELGFALDLAGVYLGVVRT